MEYGSAGLNRSSPSWRFQALSVTSTCTPSIGVTATAGDVHDGELTPLAEVDEVLGRLVAEGYDAVNFMGAETTLRTDVPELFGLVRSHGLRVALTTNGVRLADATFADRILPLVDLIEFSFPTTDAGVYRHVTGRAHLPRALQAFDNVCQNARAHPLVVTVNIVTGRANVEGPAQVAAPVATVGRGVPSLFVHLVRARHEGRAGVTLADKANLDRRGQQRPPPCWSCALLPVCPGVESDVLAPAGHVRSCLDVDLNAIRAAILSNPVSGAMP